MQNSNRELHKPVFLIYCGVYQNRRLNGKIHTDSNTALIDLFFGYEPYYIKYILHHNVPDRVNNYAHRQQLPKSKATIYKRCGTD